MRIAGRTPWLLRAVSRLRHPVDGDACAEPRRSRRWQSVRPAVTGVARDWPQEFAPNRVMASQISRGQPVHDARVATTRVARAVGRWLQRRAANAVAGSERRAVDDGGHRGNRLWHRHMVAFRLRAVSIVRLERVAANAGTRPMGLREPVQGGVLSDDQRSSHARLATSNRGDSRRTTSDGTGSGPQVLIFSQVHGRLCAAALQIPASWPKRSTQLQVSRTAESLVWRYLDSPACDAPYQVVAREAVATMSPPFRLRANGVRRRMYSVTLVASRTFFVGAVCRSLWRVQAHH